MDLRKNLIDGRNMLAVLDWEPAKGFFQPGSVALVEINEENEDSTKELRPKSIFHYSDLLHELEGLMVSCFL